MPSAGYLDARGGGGAVGDSRRHKGGCVALSERDLRYPPEPDRSTSKPPRFHHVTTKGATMIDIPYSDHREENERRFRRKPAHERCLLCGRPVRKERAQWVHVHEGGSSIVTEEEAFALNVAGQSGGDMYGFPIGPDCWRSHPELHPYGSPAC